jgi:hydrogenase expression/formation protein HypE
MAKMQDTHILLAHGGGGQLTAELVAQVILPALGGQDAKSLTDAATVATDGGGRVVFTTDTYVVQPLEFPGGDIGKLCICGTVNDLAVSGAKPVAISLALVLEEGLEIELLRRMLASAGKTAVAAGVAIVTGDTKVVERRGQPGMYINTAGIGTLLPGADLNFTRIAEGDAIILSGPLGQHGMAVMCKRKGLGLADALKSDCAPLFEATSALIAKLGKSVKWMRDPTRGGLAATLSELSQATGRNVEITQSLLPTDPAALAASEMLGIDLISTANEGKLVAIVAADAAAEAVKILRATKVATAPVAIGHVGETTDLPLVEMLTRAGGRRILQMPYGEDLPRIC